MISIIEFFRFFSLVVSLEKCSPFKSIEEVADRRRRSQKLKRRSRISNGTGVWHWTKPDSIACGMERNDADYCLDNPRIKLINNIYYKNMCTIVGPSPQTVRAHTSPVSSFDSINSILWWCVCVVDAARNRATTDEILRSFYFFHHLSVSSLRRRRVASRFQFSTKLIYRPNGAYYLSFVRCGCRRIVVVVAVSV